MKSYSYTFTDCTEECSYLLDTFIKLALPEDDLLSEEDDSAEEYLSQFISSATETYKNPNIIVNKNSIGNIRILKSHFISSFSDFDYSSSIDMIMVLTVRMPVMGSYTYTPDATFICYTLSGQGDIYVNGKVMHSKKYDCVCVNCQREMNIRAYPGEPWDCAVIRVCGHFDSDLFPELCTYLSQNGSAFLTFGPGTRFRSISWDLLSTKTENDIHNVALYNHLLLGLFLELDMAITLASNKPMIIPDIIIKIQNYLDTNYSSDINLDFLAKKFSISKYHMSREFKKHIGKSPIDYLIDVRINRAKALLYDSDRQISEISQLVGIDNPNHFLYLFKEREGITPTAFRHFKL